MALGAYQLAERLGSCFLYLQSDRKKMLIYRYRFSSQGAELIAREEVPALLTLDDYLKIHYYAEAKPKTDFEVAVYEVLLPVLDEVKASLAHGRALEIDLMLRRANKVGIAEVKSGKKAWEKTGIDQLNTATEQRFLGTYVSKFLILDRPYGSDNLALAKAHRIKVIELSSVATGSLSREDRQKLVAAVSEELGR